jgi:hypothetical protein
MFREGVRVCLGAKRPVPESRKPIQIGATVIILSVICQSRNRAVLEHPVALAAGSRSPLSDCGQAINVIAGPPVNVGVDPPAVVAAVLADRINNGLTIDRVALPPEAGARGSG